MCLGTLKTTVMHAVTYILHVYEINYREKPTRQSDKWWEGEGRVVTTMADWDEQIKMMVIKLWRVCLAPRQECWASSLGCRLTGVWVSGHCTQTGSKASRAIWCLSVWTWNVSRKCSKSSEGRSKVCPEPPGCRGGRLADGLSEIHTEIQMASAQALLQKTPMF